MAQWVMALHVQAWGRGSYPKQLHERNVTCTCDSSAKEGRQRLEDLRAGWAANIVKSQQAPGSVKGLYQGDKTDSSRRRPNVLFWPLNVISVHVYTRIQILL